MSCGGGGGGTSRRRPRGGGDGRGGSVDGRFVRGRQQGGTAGGGDAALQWDAEEGPPRLAAPTPPRPTAEKAWTSGGSTSSGDPMSHYVSQEG